MLPFFQFSLLRTVRGGRKRNWDRSHRYDGADTHILKGVEGEDEEDEEEVFCGDRVTLEGDVAILGISTPRPAVSSPPGPYGSTIFRSVFLSRTRDLTVTQLRLLHARTPGVAAQPRASRDWDAAADSGWPTDASGPRVEAAACVRVWAWDESGHLRLDTISF